MCAAFSEDLGSLLGTYVGWLAASYSSSFRESSDLFWFPRALAFTYAYPHKGTRRHIIKYEIFLTKVFGMSTGGKLRKSRTKSAG